MLARGRGADFDGKEGKWAGETALNVGAGRLLAEGPAPPRPGPLARLAGRELEVEEPESRKD